MEQRKSGSGQPLGIIVAIIIAILATILVIQNSTEVSIQLWFWKVRSSLVILLPITLLLGMLFTFLLMIGRLVRLRKENKRLRKALKAKEEQENTSQKKEPGMDDWS